MMMSIALERRNTGSNRIEGSSSSRFILAGLPSSSSSSTTTFSIMSTGMFPGDQKRMMMIPLSNNNMSSANKEPEDDSCSSSSSSIGRNSDLSQSSDGDTEEVQSSYKGPLDTMDALEEVLPIRRGISNFYRGKSKSFTSLADVSLSTVKDIAKPDNAYTRKRKNLIACTNILDKNRGSSPLRSNVGGISKRLANCNRSTVAMAMAVGTCSSESNTSGNSNSPPSSSPRHLPPLHPPAGKSSLNNVTPSSSPPPRRNFSSWRSFSLTDLQCAADSSAGSSSISKRDESTKKCQ